MMKQSLIGVLLTILAALATANSCHAQAERFELGRRLRALERAWEEHDSPEARRRALPHLKEAVNQFFGFRMGEAGRALTLARWALRSAEKPSDEELWAESLYVIPESRLLDSSAEELNIKLAELYPSKCKRPTNARLRLELFTVQSEPTIHEVEIGTLPQAIKFPLKETEQQHELRGVVKSSNQEYEVFSCRLATVDRLSDRLRALKKAIQAWPKSERTVLTESCKSYAAVLQSLAEEKTPETDHYGTSMLRIAEEMVEAVTQDKPYPYWHIYVDPAVTLSIDDKSTSIRMMNPGAQSDKKLKPLVIAMHGAGGSENMFFDAYGNGKIRDLCSERSWLLVTTRNGGPVPLAALVDELAKILPVDKKRVFLVGHSMGAAQAVNAVQQTPDRFAGVAALGGGGIVRDKKTLENVPFFVGVGTEDFALRNARSLAENLKNRGGSRRVELKEYPDIEHLMIVQTALKDVFEFFDSIAKRPN